MQTTDKYVTFWDAAFESPDLCPENPLPDQTMEEVPLEVQRVALEVAFLCQNRVVAFLCRASWEANLSPCHPWVEMAWVASSQASCLASYQAWVALASHHDPNPNCLYPSFFHHWSHVFASFSPFSSPSFAFLRHHHPFSSFSFFLHLLLLLSPELPAST